MKHFLLCVVLCFVAFTTTMAQQSQESTQPISKKATKGFIYSIDKTDKGDLNVTYKISGENKRDVLFETYSFDKQLKFLSSNDVDVPKESKDDRVKTVFYATVGGASSFDVLSMKLKLNKRVLKQSWSHETQNYITTKVVSDETIKAKNEGGKAYKGYASYSPSTDDENTLFVIAANDKKEKKQANPWYILKITPEMEITEKTIDVTGNQSLVYCEQFANDDVMMVFAPQKGEGDPSAYTYLRYSIKGELLNKIPFKAPVNALLIMNAKEQNGSVYFSATSTKSKGSYDEVFADYSPIPGTSGFNAQDSKWENKATEKMEKFHLLKFSDGKMIFATTAPISEFKEKFKPSGKASSVYKGEKFSITNFYITPDEEFLIAGQLTGHATVKSGYGGLNGVSSTVMTTYKDIVCLHFDKNGQLKAQYGVERLNDDKKSEIFNIPQKFYLGNDKKTLYWELLDVKGKSGYSSWMDSMNGDITFYPLYIPRIAKIDLSNTKVNDFTLLGNKKFYLRKDSEGQYDKKENSMTYVGHDEDYKKLWIGKYSF